MTLDDLRDLRDRYVPLDSRHPDSFSAVEKWWYAHELGHLLTVPPRQIGQVMFGLDGQGDLDEHELRCRELAAMSVSRRLLDMISLSGTSPGTSASLQTRLRCTGTITGG